MQIKAIEKVRDPLESETPGKCGVFSFLVEWWIVHYFEGVGMESWFPTLVHYAENI